MKTQQEDSHLQANRGPSQEQSWLAPELTTEPDGDKRLSEGRIWGLLQNWLNLPSYCYLIALNPVINPDTGGLESDQRETAGQERPETMSHEDNLGTGAANLSSEESWHYEELPFLGLLLRDGSCDWLLPSSELLEEAKCPPETGAHLMAPVP